MPRKSKKQQRYRIKNRALERAIQDFLQNGSEVYPENGARRSAATELRRVLLLSEVTTLNGLISEEGQVKIIEARLAGKISDRSFHKIRSTLQWLIERQGGHPIGAFRSRKKPEIYRFTPELRHAIGKLWENEVREGAQPTTLGHFLTLWRHLARRIEARCPADLMRIKPSDLVGAFFDASVRGESLKVFSLTGRLTNSIRVFQEENGQPVRESFRSFRDSLEKNMRTHPKVLQRKIDYTAIEPAFLEDRVYWTPFAEAFRMTFSPAISEYVQRAQTFPNKKTDPRQYVRFQDYLRQEFFGTGNDDPNAWANKPDGRFSPIDRTRFARFVGIALQVTTPTRFFSEMGPVTYRESTPLSDPYSPSAVFFWEERKAWALFVSAKDRKNEIPSLQPYNDLVDRIIEKYVRVFQLRDGHAFLQAGIDGVADELKRVSVRLVGSFSSLEEIKMGSPLRSLTPHRFRSVFTKVIQFFYEGEDKGVLEAVALGETPKLREGETRMSDIYGAVLRHAILNFDKLRRIKNGSYESDLNLRFQRVEDLVRQVSEEQSKELREAKAMMTEMLRTINAMERRLQSLGAS